MEKTPKVVETFKLVEPSKEAKVSKMEESPKVADPCELAKATDRAEVEPGRRARSLLQLPQTAVKSVSTLMVTALQSGWQMCSWKVSTIFPWFPMVLLSSQSPHDSFSLPVTCSAFILCAFPKCQALRQSTEDTG